MSVRLVTVAMLLLLGCVSAEGGQEKDLTDITKLEEMRRSLYPEHPPDKIYSVDTLFEVRYPVGMVQGVYKGAGGVFVSSLDYDAIFFVEFDTYAVHRVAGVLDKVGDDDGAFKDATFSGPSRMCYDETYQFLYVGDKRTGHIRVLYMNSEWVLHVTNWKGQRLQFNYGVQNTGIFPGFDLQINGKYMYITDTLQLYSLTSDMGRGTKGRANIPNAAEITVYNSLTTYMEIHNYPQLQQQPSYVYSAAPDGDRSLIYVSVSFAKNVVLAVPMGASKAADVNSIYVLIGDEDDTFEMCSDCYSAPSVVNGYFGDDPAAVALTFPMHLKYSKLLDSLFIAESYPVLSEPSFYFGSQTIRRADLSSKVIETYIGKDFSNTGDVDYHLYGTTGGYLDGPVEQAELSYPIAIDVSSFLDSKGYPIITIADLENSAVRFVGNRGIPTMSPTIFHSEAPTKAEQFHTEAPTKESQFVTLAPTPGYKFSTFSPTKEAQYLSQGPTTAAQLATPSPSNAQQFHTEGPTTVDQRVTEAPTSTEQLVTHVPTRSAQFTTPSPTVSAQFVTSAPTVMVTQAPTIAQQFSTHTPTISIQFSTHAPSKSEQYLTQTPTVDEQFFTQAPSLPQQLLTMPPSSVHQFVTRSPTSSQQLETASPSLGAQFVTNIPTLAQQHVTAVPTTNAQFLTHAPSLVKQANTEPPTAVVQFFTEAPSSAQQFYTANPTSGEQFHTEAPTSQEQLHTEAPTSAQQFSTSAPSTEIQHLTSVPTKASQVVTSVPSKEGQFITRAPTMLAATETPTRAQQFVTRAPTLTNQLSTPAPSKAEQFRTAAPSAAEQFHTEAPTVQAQLNTAAPTAPSQHMTRTPTLPEQFFSAEPSDASQYHSVVPTSASQRANTDEPTRRAQHYTRTPTLAAQFVTSIPTTTAQFTTPVPTVGRPTPAPSALYLDGIDNDDGTVSMATLVMLTTTCCLSGCCCCCLLYILFILCVTHTKKKKDGWAAIPEDSTTHSPLDLESAMQLVLAATVGVDSSRRSSTEEATESSMQDTACTTLQPPQPPSPVAVKAIAPEGKGAVTPPVAGDCDSDFRMVEPTRDSFEISTGIERDFENDPTYVPNIVPTQPPVISKYAFTGFFQPQQSEVRKDPPAPTRNRPALRQLHNNSNVEYELFTGTDADDPEVGNLSGDLVDAPALTTANAGEEPNFLDYFFKSPAQPPSNVVAQSTYRSPGEDLQIDLDELINFEDDNDRTLFHL